MSELLRRLLFLPDPASGVARDVDRLHFFVISVTFAGAFVVFAAATWFCIRYRRTERRSYGESVRAPRRLELGVAGGLLALFVVWWLLGFRQYVRMQSPPPAPLVVNVIAKQWMWKFEYGDGTITLGMLVVPAGQDVRLLFTSRDVIHSFYVPNLRLKQDAVPSLTTSLWFQIDRPGVFPVYCAEYCGQSHSRMWASVVALSPADWERYLRGEKPDLVASAEANAVPGERTRLHAEQPIAERGRDAVAKNGCLACHTVDGQSHIGPTFLGLYGSRVELSEGGTIVADDNYLTRSMLDPAAEVVRGYQPLMPTYKGSLSQPETLAIVAYIRSLEHTQPSRNPKLPEVRP